MFIESSVNPKAIEELQSKQELIVPRFYQMFWDPAMRKALGKSKSIPPRLVGRNDGLQYLEHL